MKLYHIAFSFLLSLTAAQESQENVSRHTAVEACIVGCPAVSICCIAACEGYLCPVGLYADRVAHCVSNCPLGTGTPADAAVYTQCRQDCFFSNLPPDATSVSTTNTVSTTRGTSSPPLTSSAPYSSSSSVPSASSSHEYTGTATNTRPTPSMTSNAASVNAHAHMGGVMVGLLGAILADI